MSQLKNPHDDPQFAQMLGKILRLLAPEGEIDLEYLSSITIYVLSATEIPQEKFLIGVVSLLTT